MVMGMGMFMTIDMNMGLTMDMDKAQVNYVCDYFLSMGDSAGHIFDIFVCVAPTGHHCYNHHSNY